MPLLGALSVIAALGSPAPVAPLPKMWVEFDYTQRCIYVPVSINGQPPRTFLLDTGANVSAVDEDYARKIDLKIEGAAKVEGTAGKILASKTKLGSIKCGDAASQNLEVTVQNLEGLIDPEGKETVGILGNDFLHHYSVQIDFENEKVSLLEKEHKLTKNQFSIPIRLDNGIPRFTASLNGTVSCDFRIDTGASLFESENIYLNIPENTWYKLQEKQPDLRPTTVFKGVGIGGEIQLPVSRIDVFDAQGFLVTRPYVIVQPKQGYFARPDAAGFVSNNLLEKFSPVIVDYVANKLILTKSD